MNFSNIVSDMESAMETIRKNEASIATWKNNIQDALDVIRNVRTGAIRGLREDVFDEARMVLRRNKVGFVFKTPITLAIIINDDKKGGKCPREVGVGTELKLSRNGKREVPTICCDDGNDYDLYLLADASVEALAKEILTYEQENNI